MTSTIILLQYGTHNLCLFPLPVRSRHHTTTRLHFGLPNKASGPKRLSAQRTNHCPVPQLAGVPLRVTLAVSNASACAQHTEMACDSEKNTIPNGRPMLCPVREVENYTNNDARSRIVCAKKTPSGGETTKGCHTDF